jgi:hypothetical protein
LEPERDLGARIEEVTAMNRPSVLNKLSRAARLSAEAARLYAEAAEELSAHELHGEVPPVTEVDQARARRALRKAGARI